MPAWDDRFAVIHFSDRVHFQLGQYASTNGPNTDLPKDSPVAWLFTEE
jgi:hypothetical protein